MLQATNETYAACGIPTRDQTGTLIGPVASVGALALLMVLIRLVDRFVSAQAQLGWDDFLIGLSGVSAAAADIRVPNEPELTQYLPGRVHRHERACYRCCETGFWSRHVGNSSRQYNRELEVAVCGLLHVHARGSTVSDVDPSLLPAHHGPT